MEIIKYCKALADETRARLVNLLLLHELNVGEIVQIMDMGQSRISRHLKILSDSGLVVFRREGLWAFYRASESGPGRDFLDGVTGLFLDEDIFVQDLNLAAKIIRERTVETRQFFDAIAPEWERLSREVMGELDLTREIRARMKDCECAVDLGCGPGDLLEALSGSATTVIGVDNSSRMLELAEERFSRDTGVSLRIGELSHLPLRDEEADCVVMSLVLHHLATPMEAIREVARVLRSDGQLLIAEFDRHDNEIMRSEYGDRRLGISKAKMLNWLEQSGFKPGRITEFPVSMDMNIVLYEAEKE